MKSKKKTGAPYGSQNALRGDVVASKHIHVRVTPELMLAAKSRAEADGKTFSAWIIDLVRDSVDRENLSQG